MTETGDSQDMEQALVRSVAAVVDGITSSRGRIVLGLSGGIDSVVLLHILRRRLRLPPSRLSVLHVNHGLSSHAAAWAAFCRQYCKSLSLRLQVVQVKVERGNSTEAAARSARYAAFARCGADAIVLGHNRDDQAETVLLQLLRGAGPRGLAAMPQTRAASGKMRLVRPLLGFSRQVIAGYAQQHGLKWVEDDSNTDRTYLRNFLRHDVLPLIYKRLPGASATLARAARLQAEASELMDMLAEADLGDALLKSSLPVSRIAELPPSRARNVLRYFLRKHGLSMPAADRLDDLMRQVHAREDARVLFRLGDVDLRRFRGELHVVPWLTPVASSFRVAWNAANLLPLPQLGGTLRLRRQKGAGIAVQWLQGGRWSVRVRQGGEMIKLSEKGSRRTLRNLMQETQLPPWVRERWPLLYRGHALVAVPGIGVDARFQCKTGQWGKVPVWEQT